jgi:hypothetical protein
MTSRVAEIHTAADANATTATLPKEVLAVIETETVAAIEVEIEAVVVDTGAGTAVETETPIRSATEDLEFAISATSLAILLGPARIETCATEDEVSVFILLVLQRWVFDDGM